jgi:hypothetical protein
MPDKHDLKALKWKIVSWLVLVISTIAIQYSSSKVDDYQNKLNNDSLIAINILQTCAHRQLLVETSNFKQFLPFESLSPDNIEKIKQEIYTDQNYLIFKDPQYKVVNNDLKAGKIDLRGFFGLMSSIHKKKLFQATNKYNKKVNDVKKYREKGTPWTKVINYSIVVQVILLGYLGYAYTVDMLKISKQLSSK